MTPDGPVIFAHRGASRAFPENSEAAFRAAARLGATWVETDVRLTADGALAVHHDAVYADGRPVASTHASARPDGVLLVEQALEACGSMGVNIEVKNLPTEPDFDPSGAIADVVAAALAGHGGPLLVSCFYLPTLLRFHRAAPDVPIAWLLPVVGDAAAAVSTAVEAGCAAIHPHETAVGGRIVALAHDAGLAVNTWTVDDPERMRELADLGVDGIMTNVPDVAVAALANRELA